MFFRFRSLSPLCLALLAPSFAASSELFENTAIVRTVELGGSLVYVTTTYAVKSLQPGATIYTVALTSDEEQKTSWIQAKVKGQQNPLVITEQPALADSDPHLLDIELPKTLPLNGTIHLVLETVQTHATHAWPKTSAQNEGQSLKYGTSLFVTSPYRTLVQRTKIRSPSDVRTYTQPENLEEFTQDPMVTKSGSTITYGPYNNIPSSSDKDFANTRQKPIVIHYKYDQPVLEVTKLKRAVEISHWGANLNIQDEIILRNAGPALKGHFSRLEHQTQAYRKHAAPHILHGLTLHLPAGVQNAYYYDLIGNVSTSSLRTAPSVGKSLALNQFSVLELKPRYPLLGGWNYTFTLGWDSPLADSASWDKSTGKYIVQIPIMTHIPGSVVNDEELKIILPEGARDVEFFPPFPAVSNWLSTHVTFLDTTGRPQLLLKYNNLTDKHLGTIYVSYRVPFSAHLKKPVAVFTAFFGFFLFALIARRVDLRIHKSKSEVKKR